MTLGLNDPERRYRRRLRGTVFKAGFYLAILGGVGVFSYQIGVEQVESRERQLRDVIATLEDRLQGLEQAAIQAQASARTAEARYEEAQTRLEQEVPTGEIRELMSVVARRLNDGVSVDRLEFFIDAADQARDCADPSTRRFIMPTQLYQGANTSVGFADGRITVTGIGEATLAADGSRQAWFDPAAEVTVRFTIVGGQETVATGLLPLHQSVVLGDREFRFTITEGEERSFVQVTADSCPFP